MFRVLTVIMLLLNSTVILSQDSIPKQPEPSQAAILSAPVIIQKDTLFYIKGSLDSYPVSVRAEEISKHLSKMTKLYNRAQDSIYLKPEKNYISIMYNDEVAFVVTPSDAKFYDMYLEDLSEMHKESFLRTLNKKEELSTTQWLKRIGLFLVSLLVLILLLKLINFSFKKIDKRLSKIERNFLRKKENLIRYFIPKSTANIFVLISKITRYILIIFLLLVYAPFMFSFFPWAEHIVHLFYGYIKTPVMYIFQGFIDFIPSLIFIIVIIYVARYVVRVIKYIAQDIKNGKLKIKNFHKDWAQPTQKIITLFIYAFSLVLIYPYLPGSGSSAFQGVSIFIGAIISFGSTSAIANIIAGIVITYMRPFQIGDRVKIDQIIGDVVEKNILVTHVRTPKNEDVTIPNANILVNNIVNFSNNDESNTILHTTVTLGYDLPWKRANELLIAAARQTPLVLENPEPFVLQTSLDDYYVSYELNVHTKDSKKIPWIYSEIHKNILDVFNEAGVEILSPAYNAVRDGNITTVPSQLKPNDRGPLNKLVDHLTGRNQKIVIKKGEEPKD
ncbi:mechanosensitive ion channel family protein [Urechidicola sp. KH5]